MSGTKMNRTNASCMLMWMIVIMEMCSVVGTMTEYGNARDDSDGYHWTDWTRWSECSRTCGGGASYQTRGCSLGYVCRGRTIRYKTCNTQECPLEKLDFRAQQCAAYNDEKFENRTIEWEPVENLLPEEQCSLVCRVRNHNFTRMLAPKVLDGTRCNQETRDMCIAGRCEAVSCDYQFNSTAFPDRCGICNGDNSTCAFLKGRKPTASRVQGLEEVMVIPAGSHAIKLTSKDLASTLGVHEKGEISGLNQQAGQAEEGKYKLAGTVVQYRQFRSGREQILFDGPITTDVIVTVFRTQASTISEKVHFQFLAPRTHSWKTRGWSRCSATCAGGQQTSVVECTNLATGETVMDSSCEGQKPEIKIRGCNNINCPPEWEPEPWQSCSKTCGTGNQVRQVFCVEKAPNNMLRRVGDDLCSGAKPATVQTCSTDSCPYWKPAPWSQCSVTCGTGISTRPIQCRNHRNHPTRGCDPDTMPSTRKVCLPGVPCLPDVSTSKRPVVAEIDPQPLVQDERPSYHTGEWSSCSTSCGPGIRTRNIRCKAYLRSFDSVIDLSDFECQGLQRPDDVEECQVVDCSVTGSAVPTRAMDPNDVFDPDPTQSSVVGPGPDAVIYTWRYVGFTECSASCVGGVQEAIIHCVNAFSDAVVSDAFCDYSQKLQSIQQSCNDQPCPPEWRVILYSECSSSCGEGFKFPQDSYCTQTIAHDYPQIVSDDLCLGLKPVDPVPCGSPECPAFWVPSPWSECSATCGQGSGNRTRTLSCHQVRFPGDDVEVPPYLCPHSAPAIIEECEVDQCPLYWITQPSSECSRTCGNGTQSVTLNCRQTTASGQEIEVSPISCPFPPPPNTQHCNAIDCPAEWMSHTLSQCSRTCGVGIKLRSVLCSRLLANGSQVFVDSQHCDPELRPADHVMCNLPRCYNIQILANYSVYHQPGLSSKVRLVVGQDAYIYPPTTITVKCPVVNVKKNRVVWERGTTPILGVGDSRIKVVKGGILRIKYVTESDAGVYACRAGDQRETFTLYILEPAQPLIPSDQGSVTKPNSTSSVRWFMGDWSECSVSCGGGLQTREVYCQHTNLVGRSRPRGAGICKNEGLEEPESRLDCNMQPCRPHWVTDPWSQCSDECTGASQALQTRLVYCQSATLDILPDHMCPMSTRPLHEQICANDACLPKWLVTKWSSCSSSCGINSVQKRKIKCVAASTKKTMDSSICTAVFGQPPIMKKCLLDPCPNEACVDEGSYCSLVQRLHMCSNPSYQRRCCSTCLSYG